MTPRAATSRGGTARDPAPAPEIAGLASEPWTHGPAARAFESRRARRLARTRPGS